MCTALQLPNLSIPSQLYKPDLLDARTVSRKHNDDHHPYFLPPKLLHEGCAMQFVQDIMFKTKGRRGIIPVFSSHNMTLLFHLQGNEPYFLALL